MRMLLAVSWAGAALLLAQTGQSYTPKQRIDRIRELGKRDAQAIPALAAYLNDPDRDIRVEAIKAIVKIDTADSLAPLEKATHENDAEIQMRATDGLVNFYLPGYVVKGAITGTVVRGARQVKSFFSSRNDQRIDPAITVRPDVANALADEIRGAASMDARANAARAAGILRAQPAVDALTVALRSKNTDLIFESLIALQKIGDASAGPNVAFLLRDLDDRVQVAALETIGVLRAAGCAPQVRGALRDARNTKIRRAALETLAMLGIPEDRPLFQQYLSSDDADLRAAAIEGLGRIREPEDTPAIQRAYDEQNADPKVHLAGAFALVNEGKLETSDFSPIRYLVDNLDVRGRSSIALAYVTELSRRDDVVQAVTPLIAEANKDQKIALCSAFGSSGSAQTIPVLTRLSNDIDPDVSIAAARALKAVRGRAT